MKKTHDAKLGTTASPTTKQKLQSRQARNNNWLNIRRVNGQWWQGQVETPAGGEKTFCVFRGPDWGYRAAFKTLDTYWHRYNCRTLGQIIARWAPPTENNVEAYTSAVEGLTFIGRNDQLAPPSVNERYLKIVAAMCRVESGQEADLQDVRHGYDLYLMSLYN